MVLILRCTTRYDKSTQCAFMLCRCNSSAPHTALTHSLTHGSAGLSCRTPSSPLPLSLACICHSQAQPITAAAFSAVRIHPTASTMLKRKAAFDAKHGKSTTTATASARTATAQPAKKQRTSTSTTTTATPPTLTPGHSDLTHYQNKQRTLVLSTRGITYRDRHLMSDLLDLMPHAKKDNKLDTKHSLSIINELAVLKSCNNVIFLEGRKHTDLYLWVGRLPSAGSVKFLVQNVHTMAEVKMTGNSMKYSRPLLVFDPLFDSQPHLQYIRAILHAAIAAPKGHPRVKPFIDHVLAFYYIDSRVWIRHYQIIYDNTTHTNTPPPTQPAAPPAVAAAAAAAIGSGLSNVQLVEIGPRLCLAPIRIFSGSFEGATLWESSEYVSPNELRAEMRKRKGEEYRGRVEGKQRTREHKRASRMDDNEVDAVFEADMGDEETEEK